MADAQEPAAPAAAKAKRSEADVRTDLDKAKAEHLTLLASVEEDRKKINASRTRRHAFERAAKITPDQYEGLEPPDLYGGDGDLQKKFHAQHYVIARLERELDTVNPSAMLLENDT
jgi:hypothetical protein